MDSLAGYLRPEIEIAMPAQFSGNASWRQQFLWEPFAQRDFYLSSIYSQASLRNEPSHCVGDFSCCDKTFERSNLRTEDFALAYEFYVIKSVTVEKIWW